jgi:hypothetical protein
MGLRLQVTFDAENPARLADFWALALGYVAPSLPEGFESWEDLGRAIGLPEERLGDYAALVDPDGVGPRLWFQKVREGKGAENRMHLDVDPKAGPDEGWPAIVAHAKKLEAAGAHRLYEKHDVCCKTLRVTNSAFTDRRCGAITEIVAIPEHCP